jgi:hypothetical protein
MVVSRLGEISGVGGDSGASCMALIFLWSHVSDA